MKAESSAASSQVACRPGDKECIQLPSTSPLTGREWEVASLIAKGLTNHEIAERLVIAVKIIQKNASRIADREINFDRFEVG